MTTRVKPVRDATSGDFIFKIEPGMVVHELHLVTKVKSETDVVREIVLVTGNEREDNAGKNKNFE